LGAIACCLMTAVKTNLDVQLEPPTDPSVSIFLSRLGFNDYFEAISSIPFDTTISSRQEEGNVIVRFTQINHANDVGNVQSLLESRLSRTGQARARNALIESLRELAANVFEHSHSSGFVAAVTQDLGRRHGHVDLVIGDAGQGLRASLSRKGSRVHPVTDHDAIDLAVEYGVSTTGDPGRGQGLASTLELVKELEGGVVVRSGGARHAFTASRSSELGHLERDASVPFVQGTLVLLRIPC